MTNRLLKIAFMAIIATACNEDKKCTPPPIAQLIVGVWTASLVSEKDESQEMTFEANGTLKESEGFLFGKYNNPAGTWEAKNDSLFVSGKFSNGVTETYKCGIESNSCEEVVLNLEGMDQLKLVKK